MPERREWCLAAVALALAASNVGAQASRALEFRVDSLAAASKRAEKALRAYDDSVRRLTWRFDTVQVGGVRLVVEPSLTAIVVAAASTVVDSVAAALGPAMNGAASHTYLVGLRPQSAWEGRMKQPREAWLSIVSPSGAEAKGWRTVAEERRIAETLRHGMLYTAFTVADRGFFGWIGSTVPTDTVHTSEWARHRLLLVSSPASVGLRCYQGDIEACRLALRLDPVTDPIMEWFDAPARRRLVEQHRGTARRISGRAAIDCERGSDSACVALLQRFPPSVIREPVPPIVRFGLVGYALGVGGTGALQRLLAGEHSIDDRIAAAAKLPIDAVLRGWQQRVRGTRAPSRDLSAGIALMATAWAACFGFLSLRSSRWR